MRKVSGRLFYSFRRLPYGPATAFQPPPTSRLGRLVRPRRARQATPSADPMPIKAKTSDEGSGTLRIEVVYVPAPPVKGVMPDVVSWNERG